MTGRWKLHRYDVEAASVVAYISVIYDRQIRIFRIPRKMHARACVCRVGEERRKRKKRRNELPRAGYVREKHARAHAGYAAARRGAARRGRDDGGGR